MNEEELPEDGTPVAPAVQHSPATDIETEEQVNEILEENLEEEFEDEELDDEEQEEFEDDEEFVTAKSLLDEIFDEDDLGEVMSELDVLTLEDAAAYLKVEYGQIRRLIKEQGLPGRKIGEEWRFLRGAIADWLSGESTEPAAEAERSEFKQRPPLRERFAQDSDEGQQRYPQQGNRYPQGGNRNQQEGRPPRRYNNEGGGYQGGNQGGNRFQGGNQFQGGQYNQGNQYNQGGGNPPPRRPRYGNDQEQQAPQGEYRPPQRGNFGNQGGGNQFSGGGGGGQFGGGRQFGGPKKPKRKALNEQRFKRLDRRKFEDGGDQGGSQDSQD